MSDGITDTSNHERKLIEEWQRQTIDNFLKDLSKEELVNELCKREGVESTFTTTNGEWYLSRKGAAKIIVVRE